MKQIYSFSILFTFVLLLLAPNLAAAELIAEAFEIPYQINNSDHILIGTVSGIEICDYYTNNTIAVDEWLYNSLPENTLTVMTNIGTNASLEDEAEFTKNEPVLLMLKDQRPDEGVFRVSDGYAGKHSISDRDTVIKELKAQGKWKREDQTGNISNSTENENEIPQRLPLTFGPGTLDKLKSNPDFIAAYGSIPAFSNQDDRKQWLDKLDNIYHMVIPEMSKYEYPNGPVTAFGYSIDGVLQVGVNKTVEKPFMDEIYKIFDSKASLIGIKEVPVVFVHEDLAVLTTLPVVNKTANLSVSRDKNSVELNNNSSGNEPSNKRFAPDFGLLGSLICLYGGWRLRKK